MLDDVDRRLITGKAAKIQAAWNNGHAELCEGLLQGVFSRWGPDAMTLCLAYWADHALRATGWRQGQEVPPICLRTGGGEEIPLTRFFHPKAGVLFRDWFAASWATARASQDRERCDELLALAESTGCIPDALIGVLDLARNLAVITQPSS